MATTQQKPVVNRLVVIGMGMIGGSFAKGARQRGLCEEVIAVDRQAEARRQSVECEVAHRAFENIHEVACELGRGDVVFISVPTLAVAKVFSELKCLSSDVTITDGASVKGSVARAAIEIFGALPSNLVLGHPIAGSEKSGVAAANPDLYEAHRVILTPDEQTAGDHLERIKALWQGLGAEVLSMSVAEHDEVLAATSHLPHAIAYSLVDTLAHDSENENIFRYAAGGFRDFTRIASSNPVMWHDIMLANKDSVLASLDLFSGNLARLRQAIESEDGGELLDIFERAKTARDHFTKVMSKPSSDGVD